MPSAEDSLAIIAASYRLTAETQQFLAQSQTRVELTQQYIAQTQRFGLKIQAFCCVMIGLALLFTGYMVWQHVTQSQDHAALTQALIETIERLPKP